MHYHNINSKVLHSSRLKPQSTTYAAMKTSAIAVIAVLLLSALIIESEASCSKCMHAKHILKFMLFTCILYRFRLQQILYRHIRCKLCLWDMYSVS